MPKEGYMKIRRTVLCRATQLALLVVLAGMGSAANVWAQSGDQCSAPTAAPAVGTGVVGSANGAATCGVVITISASGAATITTLPPPDNGNPYDGTEDTLVGIQNNSGGSLGSITLSSGNPIFGFDADGPCDTAYHTPQYSWCSTAVYGYEGPDNTFTNINPTTFATGTVNFTTPIPNGGSTWFALEGPPSSIGQIQVSQTQTIHPGQPTTYQIGSSIDNYQITPFNNLGGEQVTITAFLVPQGSFVPPSGFSTESCIPYADFSGPNGTTPTCVEVHQTCAQGTASSDDCATFDYQMATQFNLPSALALTGIGDPDYLYFQNQTCPTTAASTAQSVFLSYSATGTDDPVIRGGSNPTNGCFIPTYNPNAPGITGTTSTFEGFNSPVSNTALNIVKAGSTVPLQWVQLDNTGSPVITLSLCTSLDPTSGACTSGASTPWVFIQAYSVTGSLCTPTDGTDTLPTNAAGNSGLQYLGSTQPGLYKYNWKTPSGTPKGTCAEITFTYSSGVFFVAPSQFQFK
jgi:hypothetical protein